jgi:hypothetical protein
MAPWPRLSCATLQVRKVVGRAHPDDDDDDEPSRAAALAAQLRGIQAGVVVRAGSGSGGGIAAAAWEGAPTLLWRRETVEPLWKRETHVWDKWMRDIAVFIEPPPAAAERPQLAALSHFCRTAPAATASSAAATAAAATASSRLAALIEVQRSADDGTVCAVRTATLRGALTFLLERMCGECTSLPGTAQHSQPRPNQTGVAG